jgi:hypothetical protein
LENSNRIGCTQDCDCTRKTNVFCPSRRRSKDDGRRRIQEIAPVMFSDSERIQANLVGMFDLFHQIPKVV